MQTIFKKFISVLLISLLILSVSPLTGFFGLNSVSVNAAGNTSTGVWGWLTWTYDRDTYTLTISGQGPMSKERPSWRGYTIKNLVIGKQVFEISDNAFCDLSSLETITLEGPTGSIGKNAFSNCVSLVSVSIPDGFYELGESAFAGCTSLQYINFSQGATYVETTIEKNAFYNCSSLVTVLLPKNTVSIGKMAFAGCTSLKNLDLPDSIKSIGDYAFDNCKSLKTINLPESLETWALDPYRGCSSLTSYNISENNQKFSTVDGVVYNKDKTKLFRYPAGKTARTYTLPSTVNTVDNDAFDICTYIAEINVDSNNSVYASVDGVVYNKKINTLYFCPIGKSYCNVPEGVTTISYNAFENCRVYSVSLPDSLKYIRADAFIGCKSLSDIKIPSGIKTISDKVFYNCTGLKSISMPYTLEAVSNDAFSGCTSLRDVYYDGYKYEWDEIEIYSGNDDLLNATIHCRECNPHKETIIPGSPANCKMTGISDGIKCTVCGEILVEQIYLPKTSHAEEIIPGKPATCLETGISDGVKCSVCDAILTQQVQLPIGEHKTVLVNAKGPDVGVEGYTGDLVCEVCNAVISEGQIIPSLEEPAKKCTHLCHRTGFLGFIWKIINFFQRIFKINPVCECGAAHY